MKPRPCVACHAANPDLVNQPQHTWRPTPFPGPRCATHHRSWKKRSRELAHARRLESKFSITAEIYWALYEAQGGKCFICQVASGKTKKLAVEHDHRKCAEEAAAAGLPPPHPPEQGCPNCIRCLSCGRCNKLIAFLGVEALCRAIEVQVDPPARKILVNPEYL